MRVGVGDMAQAQLYEIAQKIKSKIGCVELVAIMEAKAIVQGLRDRHPGVYSCLIRGKKIIIQWKGVKHE